MTDIVFPPGLIPRRVTWTLERAVATFDSPLSFASQRVARSGARWRASIEMAPLDQFEAGLLSAWLDQISRADNCGLMPVFQNNPQGQSGSATFAELQVPWHERDANLDWSPQRLLAVPYLSNRDLVIYATSGTTPRAQISRSFTVTQGIPYLLVIDIPTQAQPGGYTVSDGVTTLVDQRTALPVAGRYRHRLIAASTTLTVTLFATNGDQAFVASAFTAMSLSRIFLSRGAVSAGASRVDFYAAAGAASPALTHRAGQFVNVETSTGWELKRLITDVHMIGSVTLNGNNVLHQGRGLFEPALRGSVVLDAPIQSLRPACRMRLAEPNSSATIDAPLFGGFAFDLVEWFGA